MIIKKGGTTACKQSKNIEEDIYYILSSSDMGLLIINAGIITFDENNPFIENGFVKIDNNKISSVGSVIDLKSKLANGQIKLQEDEKTIDAQGKIVMPGFVCTHTHLAKKFINRIKSDKEIEKHISGEDIYYAVVTSLIEYIKSGITCVFDHHNSPNSVENSLDMVEKAFMQLGMRGVLSYSVSDKYGLGVALRAIRENSRFIDKCNLNKNELIKGMFGLDSSNTLPHKVLDIASIEGNRLGTGFHIHVAELAEDLVDCRSKYNKNIMERFYDYNVVNDKSIFAHCIHINDRDKEILKSGNVIHNPESNMNKGVGYCDALDLLKRGINVGLASDGYSADVFKTMNTCSLIHKHHKKDSCSITTENIINMINNNARIGNKYFDDGIGIVKNEAKADLILVEYNSSMPINKDNINDYIVLEINNENVTHSIVDGKVIMEDRVLVGVDEKEIILKSREIYSKLR